MKLYIEQKFFTIWGRYSVYHENGDIAYYVQGYPAWGKKMINMLPYNNKVAERRKERKEKPKKQAERARELQKERMKKKGKW